jgi:putative FmdB family regulatory protein
MPIFEYHCRSCGTRFERLVSGVQATVPACPDCAGHHVERLLSAFAVTRSRPTPEAGPCGSDHCACRDSGPAA